MNLLRRKKVTELRPVQIDENLQQEHLRLFHEVARSLTATLTLESVLTTIMTHMARFFGPERWSMLLVDEEEGDLYYVIAVGEDTDSLRGLRVPMGEGMAGWVVKTGNPLIVADVASDPRWSEYAAQNPELAIQSIACIPIRAADRTLGAIQLLNSKFDLLGEYSSSFLRMLCDFAAIAIQNASSMRRIRELSITDDCTGLFNARHLYTLLDGTLARGPQHPFSLVFMDMDRFKSVNDTHGHLVGSALLAEVGDLLRRVIGPENAAFRYGGDEFVMLLTDMSKDAATDLITRLYHSMHATAFLESRGLRLRVTGSFGIATFPQDGATVQEIIKSADTMMYEVKASTRDNIAVAGQGLLFERVAIPASR